MLIAALLTGRTSIAADCFTDGYPDWVNSVSSVSRVEEAPYLPSSASTAPDICLTAGANTGGCADFCTRSTLTGGFWGAQPALAQHGIAYDAFATHFYQGVLHGGIRKNAEHGGKIDQFVNVDGDKAGLWKGFFITMHAESRYGNSVVFDAVGLAPVNANMLYPLPRQNDTAVTGLLLTQALSETCLVSVGKFNMLDLFAQMYPQTGRGITGFMNISNMIPLSSGLGTNLSILGANVTTLHEGEVRGSLGVYDLHNVTTTTGLSDVYDSGAVVIGYYRIFTEFGGLPGSHALLGIYSNGTYTSVDPTTWSFIPQVGIVAGKEDGTYNGAYFLEQKLWVDAADPKRNVGILSAVGVSDGNPNPIRWSSFVTLQAEGFNSGRPLDSFGVGFFYTGLSDEFRDLINPLIPVEDPYGGEIYYNAAVTPWFRLTYDLQVVNPGEIANDTAVVAGLRASLHL
jgi:porin